MESKMPERAGKLHFASCDRYSHAEAVQPLQHPDRPKGSLGVGVRSRPIGDQRIEAAGDRAGDGDALPPDLALRSARKTKRRDDVIESGQMRGSAGIPGTRRRRATRSVRFASAAARNAAESPAV